MFFFGLTGRSKQMIGGCVSVLVIVGKSRRKRKRTLPNSHPKPERQRQKEELTIDTASLSSQSPKGNLDSIRDRISELKVQIYKRKNKGLVGIIFEQIFSVVLEFFGLIFFGLNFSFRKSVNSND